MCPTGNGDLAVLRFGWGNQIYSKIGLRTLYGAGPARFECAIRGAGQIHLPQRILPGAKSIGHRARGDIFWSNPQHSLLFVRSFLLRALSRLRLGYEPV